ncbi:MAG: hypothetical protein E7049_04820 [Lentisphaerae bacterium]|nr:hypothetical protein [Lentisphaerota bacterium]
MKLEYAKRGRQFFFVTLVVAERRQVLSSIAELEASGQAGASGRAGRPALLPLGEIVAAALRAVHRVWPAVTISDYVVMPDHLHFLLIADYNRDRGIAPLFIAHRLADAVERAQALVEERNGRGSAPNPGRASHPGEGPNPGRAPNPSEGPNPGRAAGALAERRVEFMAGLLREAAAAAREAAPGELKVERGLRFGERRGGAGARAPVRSVVFARDCYIELSFDSRQLKAVRRYIKLNPARAIWKARHPDLFICYRAIKSERFAAFAPRRFDAIGALPILGSPFLFHVRLTLKKSVAEHEAAIQEIVEKARHGMVPVSGFISPGEKEAFRRLKAEPSARFLKLLPHALPARYDPSAEDSREIAAGRLVILSAFPDTPAVASPAMKRDPAASHRFRQNCLAMNDLAAKLCGER